jgi:hypothetical protein
MLDILCMNIWTCKSCMQSGCRACSQIDQNQQRVDDSEQCLAIFNTTLQSPIDSQPSGLNAMNRHNAWKDTKVSWHQYYGMRVELYSSITSKKARPSTSASEYYMALLERLNDKIKKKRPHLKEKSAVSSRQCSVSQINQNDGKIA